jgi:hypothetical protein
MEEHSPYTYAVKRRQIMRKYGVRATQTINLPDETHEAESEPARAIY